ncbi:MAG: hypothetical protein U1F16_12750 [Turneriella sp.]
MRAQKIFRPLWILLIAWTPACGKRTVTIDDAEKPATLTLQAPENVTSVELHVRGLLSGTARLKFHKPGDRTLPWRSLELLPVVVSGIPMGIAPAELIAEYDQRELIVVYEPAKKTQGHLEIEYRFKAR